MNLPRGDAHLCQFCFACEVYAPLCSQCKFYLSKGWIGLRGTTYIKRGKFPNERVAKQAWVQKVKERAEKDKMKYVTKRLKLASL